MPSKRTTVLVIWKILLPTMQFFGIVPLEYDSEEKRFYRTRWRQLRIVAHISTALLLIPFAYYPLLESFMIPESPLSNFLLINEMGLTFLALMVTLGVITGHLGEIECCFNGLAKLLTRCFKSLHDLDGRVLKSYFVKITLADVIVFPFTFALFIPFTVGQAKLLMACWLVNTWSILQMLLFCNLFQSVAIVGTLLYKAVNRQIRNCIDQLVHLDNQEMRWHHLDRRLKLTICKRLGTEIDHLCRLHRTITRLVQKLVRILSPPMILVTTYQCLILLAEVSASLGLIGRKSHHFIFAADLLRVHVSRKGFPSGAAPKLRPVAVLVPVYGDERTAVLLHSFGLRSNDGGGIRYFTSMFYFI